MKKCNYKIGLISNIEKPTMEYFMERDYEFFDVAIFSCAEGIRKPERKIYEIALSRLGTKPKEAIFIEDRKECIASAERIGINGILFKNAGQLKKELAKFSVKK